MWIYLPDISEEVKVFLHTKMLELIKFIYEEFHVMNILLILLIIQKNIFVKNS